MLKAYRYVPIVRWYAFQYEIEINALGFSILDSAQQKRRSDSITYIKKKIKVNIMRMNQELPFLYKNITQIPIY
jgi:hypothetical protein